jgi:hypothetical protein
MGVGDVAGFSRATGRRRPTGCSRRITYERGFHHAFVKGDVHGWKVIRRLPRAALKGRRVVEAELVQTKCE